MPLTDITEGVVLTAMSTQNAPKLEFQISNATALAVIKSEKAVAGQTAGRLSFETNNGTATSTKMLIDGQGKVGIGTLNPLARLHVAGDLTVDTRLVASNLIVSGSTEVTDLRVTGTLILPADSVDAFKLRNDSASLSKVSGGKVVVTGDNVGVGTANPLTRLHVAGDVMVDTKLVATSLNVSGATEVRDLKVTGTLTANITLPGDSIDAAKLRSDSASLSKVSGGNVVVAGNNVGVGRSNPLARLHVAGDLTVDTKLTASSLNVSGTTEVKDLKVTGTLTANVAPAADSIDASKLRSDSASLNKVSGGSLLVKEGKVGVGVQNPTGRLHVSGAVKFDGSLAVSEKLAIGISEVGSDVILDAGSRVRVRQGNSGSAGIWLSQATGDKVFVGMLDDDQVGFFGTAGVGWGLTMRGDNGDTQLVGRLGIGVPEIASDVILDVGSRMGVNQGASGSAGIWLTQAAPDPQHFKGIAFVGFSSDDNVGFHSFGTWGLLMNTVTDAVTLRTDLTVKRNLVVQGVKQFKIDHPLDPANKYLSHSSIESPDTLNIYSGNVVTDGAGRATVTLPDYFEVLNGDFRYQLTAIGQNVLATVEREIEKNSFVVRTNHPNVKVSWQVTGIRQDAAAKAYRLPVEEEKPDCEKGLFLDPELFGHSRSKGIGLARFSKGIDDTLGKRPSPKISKYDEPLGAP